MVPWVLLGMQAAGMVVDWMGMDQQKTISREGARLEQMGIEANIQMTRLQAEDASLQAMKKLRQTMATQTAYFAAQGVRANPAFANEARSEFNADERTRQINLLAKETELRSQKLLSKLHQQGYESKLTNDFTKRIFDLLPTNLDSYKSLFGSNSASSTNTLKPAVASNKNKTIFTPFTG